MGAGGNELQLDSAVRDWVFIPLTLCIALMKLLTQYAHMLLNSNAAPPTKEPREQREQHQVARSVRVRGVSRWLPESAFRMRKEYFAGKDTGIFQQKPVSKSMHESMASDPSMMVDMMKKNLTGVVPQLAMGMVVNFFFNGFVIGRVPFPLSPRFRLMLQRGIDLSSLDVSYFTSLSYYILLLFGLRGVFALVFREDAVDETAMMRQQMNPMAANPAFDAVAAFKGELGAYTQLDHEWELETSEEKAVATLKRLNKKQ